MSEGIAARVPRKQAVVVHYGPNGEWLCTNNELLGQDFWLEKPERKVVRWPSVCAFKDWHEAHNALLCAETNIGLRLKCAVVDG